MNRPDMNLLLDEAWDYASMDELGAFMEKNGVWLNDAALKSVFHTLIEERGQQTPGDVDGACAENDGR